MTVFSGPIGVIHAFMTALVLAFPAQSQTLPGRIGPAILTVTGLDPALHPGGELIFDMAMLQALPHNTITTTSIWTEGLHSFTGVPMAALAHYLDLHNATLGLHALNDYRVDMPLDEAEPLAPILAYQMDGAPMPVRDKGPIWVIYPYDAAAQYRTDTVFMRSVWQLDRIEVLP